MTIRSRVLKNSRSELIDQLANFDIVATKSPVTKQGVVIEKGNVIKTPILGMGHATVQDESSMLVSEVLNAKPNMTVLDSCRDRKSTRLNSSHVAISYAVFC